MIPSQSPLGFKYHHLFCCNSAGQMSNPIHRVKVKVLAGLGPSGRIYFLIFSGFWTPLHSFARGLFLTSSSLLFHRLLPTLAFSYKNASDHM